MALPKRITIHEVGPREGIQIEKNPIPTAEKIRFIDMLRDLDGAHDTVGLQPPAKAAADQMIVDHDLIPR